MDDIVGIAEVQLTLVRAPLKEPFRRLHPIRLAHLAFHSRRKRPQHLIVLEQFDFGVDSRADFKTENDRIMHFKLNSYTRP